MAEQPEFDPMVAWQKMISRWERQINDFSSHLSESEAFAGSMNQAAKLSFAARKNIEEGFEKLAQTAQLATRAQMVEVLDRLDRIEQKVDALADSLRRADPAAPALPKPKRTRKPAGDPA